MSNSEQTTKAKQTAEKSKLTPEQREAQRKQALDDAAKKAVSSVTNLRAYLAVQSRFERYSTNNNLLIFAQRPDATRLKSLELWNKEKKWIREGAKAVAIYEPIKKQGKDGKTYTNFVRKNNYYTFRIEVVCYGRDLDLGVNLEVFGVNAASSDDTTAGNLSLEESVPCASDQVYTLIFKYFPDENYTDAVEAYEKTLPENAVFHLLGSGEGITSYQSVHISLSVNGDAVEDSVSLDNSFDIYDGLKERIRIQYCSSGQDPLSGEKLGPNVFFQEVLAALKKNYEAKWDFDITEVKRGQAPALEGYDFYIFEHSMPADGVILLVDPLGTPSGAGFRVENLVDMSKKSVYLAQEETHPILNNIEATNITVSRYLKVSYDPEYSMLLSYAGDPLLLVRNDEDAQVAVMCFSLHYSNLPLLKDFPLMMRNLFEYFFPSTVDGNSFETEQTVSVNCRGDELTVKGYDTDLTLTQFPAQLKLSLPGSYRLSQTTRAGKAVSTTVYVRVPRAESDIFAEEGVITGPYYEVDESDYYQDLLLYLAGALVFLLLLEWYLQHKESSI